MDKQFTPEGIMSQFLYCDHTGEIAHRRTQPNEDLILEHNKRLRNEPEAFAKNDYFHQIASIPLIIWEKAIRDGYDLTCPDKEIADKELMRFLRSTEGRICMVREEKV